MPSSKVNVAPLALSAIPAVSPTLAETLRTCPLQAALSRAPGARAFVLGNPKAWLGSAYHKVLEAVWQLTGDEEITSEESVERSWQQAIAALNREAQAHPLDRRFGEPIRWPGYYLVRACVLMRARQALREVPREHRPPERMGGQLPLACERSFSAMGGKLIGKPDVVKGDEIWDYKSGAVHDASADGGQTVKIAYIRQLRLYGHLVHENVGACPRKGRLLPMQGEAVEVDLDPEVCAAEAAEAVGLLDSFNSRLALARNAPELAAPSPTSCRWCAFKAICPAFWGSVCPGWAEDLGSAAVRGVLREAPMPIHGGHASSLCLVVAAGTTSAPDANVAPLSADAHALPADLSAGDAIRLVNLYHRHDGQLAPTPATLCFRDADCPSFALPGVLSESAAIPHTDPPAVSPDWAK